MPLTLHTGVRELPGVGEARAKSLERLGLRTAGNLLGYFPRCHEDRTRVSSIQGACLGETVCIVATVAQVPTLSRVRKGLELIRVRVADETSTMVVTFFNQTYVKEALHLGESYVFYGKIEAMGRQRQMTNPIFEQEGQAQFTGCILPIYPLTTGVSNHILVKLIRRCVDECAAQMPERLPEQLRLEYKLAQSAFSFHNIHFPESWESLELARRRFIFEEFFYLTCGMALLRSRRDQVTGTVFAQMLWEPFYARLPFPLTGAQKRAIGEAAADLSSGKAMNRLVQGDVGSGKTAVAAACAWLCRENGYQSAMMAPTEILAEQHYRSLSSLLAPAGMRVGLLTGGRTAGEKRKVRAALAQGDIDLIVGTHALLSEGVEFQKLALVITDEQHRFGVAQRAGLSEKAGERTPHVLVMSATPIPRTLALIVYGDLDVSILDELPPGRVSVATYLVGEEKRERIYRFVRKLVGEGRQAYLVCPAVEEESADSPRLAGERKAAKQYAAYLGETVFPDLRVGLVHGKLKSKEKDAVMSAFAGGTIDILVSTTVIEVGVDVPNAALMVVENAERFGLSQLHQLRGRVGRGKHQSYCVLITATRNEDSRARLKILAGTTDGFQIAEEDLRLRGPGDFFGERQHGLPQLHVADMVGDIRLLKEAQTAAQALLKADPGLQKKEHQLLLKQVQAMFAQRPDGFN